MRNITPLRNFLSRLGACLVVLCALIISPSLASAEDSQPIKPLVVMIFDRNCKAWCGQVRPMLADLKNSYGNDVEFAEIDVSANALSDAKKKAKELGIGSLLEDTVDQVPLVIFCGPHRSKNYTEQVGPKSKEIYESCLKKYLPKRG